jgi:hypothetical protein
MSHATADPLRDFIAEYRIDRLAIPGAGHGPTAVAVWGITAVFGR